MRPLRKNLHRSIPALLLLTVMGTAALSQEAGEPKKETPYTVGGYRHGISFFKKAHYPDLIDLYVAGKSFEGRDIYQVTLTNKKILKETDKPAMAIDANRHSGEVTAAESAPTVSVSNSTRS